MKLGIILYEHLMGPRTEHLLIDPEGVVKHALPITKDTEFVIMILQTAKGKLSQQQYTSALVTITAMMLNYGFNPVDIVSQDITWDEIKRKG